MWPVCRPGEMLITILPEIGVVELCSPPILGGLDH